MLYSFDRTNPDVPTLTPEEIATKVLADHAIKPDWVRTGQQIRQLIIEAVKFETEQNDELRVPASQEDMLRELGLDYDDGTADDGEVPAWYILPQTIEKENWS